MAHHHNPQVRWRYVRGYMINQYMGVVIAIYFPGGIILLKVASGDEPSGIWESEMETRAVRWQVFITQEMVEICSSNNRYVPSVVWGYDFSVDVCHQSPVFGASFFGAMIRKTGLQAFRVSGVVLFLVFVWWESQGSELQTETNSELEELFLQQNEGGKPDVPFLFFEQEIKFHFAMFSALLKTMIQFSEGWFFFSSFFSLTYWLDIWLPVVSIRGNWWEPSQDRNRYLKQSMLYNQAWNDTTQAECSTSPPWKMNMEPKNGASEYEFPFQLGDF